MQCLILAGGLGTRISSVSAGLPKSLIPVLGRPFLDYQLTWLAAQGIKAVVLALGFKAELIRNFTGDGRKWGLDICFVDDGNRPLGTAGAIRQAVDHNLMDDAFFVLYGDSYLDIELSSLWRQHQKSAQPTLAVFRNDGKWDTSNVLMEKNKIKLYEKNSPDRDKLRMNYIDYGVSLLTRASILDHVPADQNYDLATLFHKLSLSRNLNAVVAARRFYEIGSPDGLADLERHLKPGPGHA